MGLPLRIPSHDSASTIVFPEPRGTFCTRTFLRNGFRVTLFSFFRGWWLSILDIHHPLAGVWLADFVLFLRGLAPLGVRG
jgi:hypothetical protein